MRLKNTLPHFTISLHGFMTVQCTTVLASLPPPPPPLPSQAEHRESGRLAALKRVPIQEESDLDDFMVEIDILAECRSPNIVGLYEAFFFDEALWVGWERGGGGGG